MKVSSIYSPYVLNQRVGSSQLFSSTALSFPTLISTPTQHPIRRYLKRISSFIRPLFSTQAEPYRRVNFFESWKKMHPEESILQAYLNRLKINWMNPDCSMTIVQDFKAYCMKHAEGECFALQKYITYNLIALSCLQNYGSAPALVKIIDSSLDIDKQRSFFKGRLQLLQIKMKQDMQWQTTNLVNLERLITELCDSKIKNSC